MLILRLYWRGEIDLPVAFWGGCIFANLVLVDKIGVTLIGLTKSTFLIRFYIALVVVFNCFVIPGVWRSARYWQLNPVWAHLARIACVALAARVAYTFIVRWTQPFM
ncbi:conserved membrane hypothetical protein [Candidatus Nitrospira nitrosa]|uniref:Uncharacterized protein n=1 Tax=Candidatus Nitrospira nitrosa TaxID=1742972 RepID=A0A0S4LD28_9BACT|nr:conserved membrane hypothetical protein [Candidatus Nitrospira nitrosa]